MAKGKVYLVGAGPGDPGLLTLRAVEILKRADIVFYDYLVNPAILLHCGPNARLISLGKHGTGKVRTQPEINNRLDAASQLFETVVRLKGGDPLVFARAAEELDYLIEHDIDFEIVPGVTAAMAAASYAGIPVTDRDAASAVALVTGQEDADKAGPSLDYAALARFPGTLVIYMGVTTAEHWSQALIAAGKPAATPVAIVRHVSLSDQKRIDCTLGDVAAVVQQNKLRPPVVFIIGDVAAHGPAWSWFEKRPLFGQKVLVTRPAHQAADLAVPLTALGAEVLLQPAINIYPPLFLRRQGATDWIDRLAKVEPPETAEWLKYMGHDPMAHNWSAVDEAITALDRLDWLVFSSANGVRYFLARVCEGDRDLRVLGKLKIAAIGPATAAELARFHLKADVTPDEFRAESLVQALQGGARGKRFLLVRASRGREVLKDELKKAGAIVEEIVAYESIDVEKPAPEVAEQMAAGKIDWTTVTSSAIARSLARMFGDSLQQTKLVSISPVTSATLRELGLAPAAEAKEYTMAGVVAAIRESVGK